MHRIGNVTAVDVEKRLVRVFFSDVGITSGWLKVVSQSSLVTLELKTDGKDWSVTEKYASADRSLGLDEEYIKEFPDEIKGVSPPIDCISHTHTHEFTLRIHGWLPFIGQPVLCLYNDEFNGDGFVIGGM